MTNTNANEETIEMLKVLKEQAVKSCDDTAILDVTIDSFMFVIDKAIEALQHQKVGKWKKIKAIQYFVGGYSCSICQTVEEQPLEYCNCCGARMEVENDT